jgi:cytochrome c553
MPTAGARGNRVGSTRRRVVRVLLVLLAAIVVVYALLSWRLAAKLSTRFAVTPTALAITHDAAAIERGRRLEGSRIECRGCHGDDLGGKVMIDNPAIGRVVAPNLTSGRGSGVADYRDEDWVRAIRHGLAADGRPLLLMPTKQFAPLSDADLAPLVAYLVALPPVDRELDGISLGPIGKALTLFGRFEPQAFTLDHAAVRPSTVPPGDTIEYGGYLANACTDCHGSNLAGGAVAPGVPDASNLTPKGKIAGWSELEFARAMRTCKTPDGRTLDPFMPCLRTFHAMDDVELRALYRYLQTLPPATPL